MRLEDVFKQISQKATLELVLTGSSQTPVTADFRAMDLDVTVKRLTRGLNSVFYYGSSQPGAQDIQLTSVLIISNPDSRTISAIRPSDDANPVQDTGAVPYHNLFDDIDRLEEAAWTDESAINELARLAEFEENKTRRMAAVEALGESDALEHAELLYNIALRDEDFDVRATAVEALGSVGDESVTGALIEALKDDGSMVRSAAAYSLADVGDKSAAPALIEALEDNDEEVREFARDALEEMEIQKGSPEKRRGLSPPPRE